MRISTGWIPGVLALAMPLSAAENDLNLTTEQERVSYAIGYKIGSNLKREKFDVDPELVRAAIQDILEERETAMTDAEAGQVIQEYQQKLRQQLQAEQAAAAARNREEGAAWLAENAGKEGVVTLGSGLQYKVLQEGSGESPGSNDTVRVQYRGTLIDGTEFDSSYSRDRPAEFRVNRVIPGWTEALQLMKPGAKWELYIPSNLAYGDRNQGNLIPPGSTLVFEVELLEVIKPKPITSDIIKVPSAEEMAKGAKIETIKASDLERLEEEARKAREAE